VLRVRREVVVVVVVGWRVGEVGERRVAVVEWRRRRKRRVPHEWTGFGFIFILSASFCRGQMVGTSKKRWHPNF